ncbi:MULTISPECIES: urea transporter [unclassified Pseudomonas]|uniref:urea transporter n=1 Tax=unclassified Pseudomonas TaxID=196821 RepID=UPI002AC9CD88|nr:MULTISPECIES: urea transporter [unclassified Pseudomonas]MEB0040953.1 urea transporter [Pseudomonas sp. MH10]MEB0121001.1 urea transporter [Pseudomonas sp. CCI1.2]WPX64342.1 urea transporter [Pseudomonas sp. MH10]
MNKISCPDWAEAILNGFSQVLLQRHPFCGMLCLLAILLTAPELLGGALLGAVAGLLTAQRRGYDKAERQAGLYSYNGVLLGVLLCHQLPWSPVLPLLIMVSGGLSAMLMHHWLANTRQEHCLKAYTAPFVLFSWLLLAVVMPHTPALNTADNTLLHAVSQGLGQIFLLDQPLAGLMIGAGLLIADRRGACWALLGCTAGIAVALVQNEPSSALFGLASYNPALAGLAFSHQRTKPWLPLFAIALAIVLQPGFSQLGLPTLTAPFVLACWLVQASARLLRQSTSDHGLHW